ncbi:acyloxyacyl hydrolase [Persicobacter sp. CCB-QB2]|uniref:acyloxyacyl hydrolase n=1 Tax=Persicobacter sp. CCB-QB2 TaxID=1561025 RepID=UPI0006A98B53|nr:acyloxyacyl hydrolase [Persicobacter sp. CCB-QB2]
MKQVLLLLLFLGCGSFYAHGQKSLLKQKGLFLEARYSYGDVIAHKPALQAITSEPYHFLDIRLGKQGLGSHAFEVLLNHPLYGLGYFRGDVGSSQIFGNPNALYGFIAFPVFRHKNYYLALEPSIGLAFNLSPFHETKNPRNVAIGSGENAFLRLRIANTFTISPQMDLDISMDYTHFSNGMTRAPNLGLNNRGLSIGLKYFFHRDYSLTNNIEKAATVRRLWGDFQDKQSIFLRYGYGVRSSDLTFKYYQVHDFSLGYRKQISYIFAFSLAHDLFYNEIAKVRNKQLQSPLERYQLLSLGLYGENELILNRLRFILGLGAYYYHGDNANEELLYWRLGARYAVLEKLWFQVALKAHASVADFVEWSVAYEIPIKKKR